MLITAGAKKVNPATLLMLPTITSGVSDEKFPL